MKTLSAALAHAGIGATQALVGAQFFNPNSNTGFLGNTAFQLLLQTGLMGLQSWVAKRNSQTDPKGQPLMQTGQNTFKTEV